MEKGVFLIKFLIMSVVCAEEILNNEFDNCVRPLGMEEGTIPDDAITASSSYEIKSVGPQNARIRQEKNGGAWCPKAQISNNIREYLEIDLTKNHLITWTETQGRFGNGEGQEYAESFFLEYWRDVKWHQYKNIQGDHVLRGNSNTYLVEKQRLDPPFIASRVRFFPYSQHPRTVCMRVEIYGCIWELPGISNTTSEQPVDFTFSYYYNKSTIKIDSNPSNYSIPTLFDHSENFTPDAFPINNSQTYIGLVSGVLTIIAVFMTCTIFLMKQRGRNKIALLQKHTTLMCNPTAQEIAINMKDAKFHTPIVVNDLTQPRTSVKIKGIFAGENTIWNGELADNNYQHCSTYERTYKVFSEGNLVRETVTHKSQRISNCSDLLSECNYQHDKSPDGMNLKAFPTNQPNYESSYDIHGGYYAATDLLTIKKPEKYSSSSSFTPMQIQESTQLSNNQNLGNIHQMSHHRLKILNKFGECSFGIIHLCETNGIQGADKSIMANRQIVLVRSLRRGVLESMKQDFMKDMLLLAAIRDTNIAMFLGVIKEDPLSAVFEYGEFGDLPTFMSTRSCEHKIPLSYECLLRFVTEIASGMKYLESLNIPHCDLAARNCIVSKHFVIKISDHAMYCSKYDQEYYVNGRYAKIPLRWMAWEAVLLGNFSCRADVWSFAITVWEIMTVCREIPFADLTSEQVLENCSKWSNVTDKFHHSGNVTDKLQPRMLSQPQLCSRELYRMMTKCWSQHTNDRPTFEEIYLFLKRLSYN